jgi:ectoine hydroxylase-related dioxygenase (phytanoyl-CoA dioxygenase family)
MSSVGNKIIGADVIEGYDEAIERIANAVKQSSEEIDWQKLSNHAAWFDLPDAHDRVRNELQQGSITQGEAQLLDTWIKDGCIVLKDIIPTHDIDEINEFVDNLLTTDTPNPDITLLGYTLDVSKGGDAVPHRDLVKLSPEQREINARLSPWRIHELRNQCPAAQRIFQSKRLNDIASLIFGRAAYPRSTINFHLGSQQELHQDMAVFHVFPGNYLIGAWIALEDISPDSGPLRYAPGSHKSGLYPRFSNHPQSTLRTCPLSEYEGYYKFTNAEAEACGGARYYLAKKGDVFLWHGMLVHGGSPVKDPSLTRKSMVIHYLTEGVDQTDNTKGPFNWG